MLRFESINTLTDHVARTGTADCLFDLFKSLLEVRHPAKALSGGVWRKRMLALIDLLELIVYFLQLEKLLHLI